jgi:uncharacterized protein YcbK (DUF882 family)
VKATGDQTSCVPKRVQNVLKLVAGKFGKVTIKSGYRSPVDNARRGGAKRSQHLGCKAVDFLIPNRGSRARQQQLASFLQQQKSGGHLRYNVYCSGRTHLDNSNLHDGYSTCVSGHGARKNYKRRRKYS